MMPKCSGNVLENTRPICTSHRKRGPAQLVDEGSPLIHQRPLKKRKVQASSDLKRKRLLVSRLIDELT
jgi:hypothetical protein